MEMRSDFWVRWLRVFDMGREGGSQNFEVRRGTGVSTQKHGGTKNEKKAVFRLFRLFRGFRLFRVIRAKYSHAEAQRRRGGAG